MKNYILLFVIVFLHQVGQTQCLNSGNQWEETWTSCQQIQSPNPARGTTHWILYEFTENHFIDSTHIWNSNRNGERNRGINNIIIDYSKDGEPWTELGAYTVDKAVGGDNYQGVAGPNFGSVELDRILITVVSTHGAGNCAAISEMLFAVNADECHGSIDACGVCDGPGASVWYIDEDGDGLGSNSVVMDACEQPFGYVDNDDDTCDNGQLGWTEVFPLFEKSCNGCHIAAVSGGLNLSTYNDFSNGGNKCGPNLKTGNNLIGAITIDRYNGCSSQISFPSMNERSSSPMSDAEIAILKRWIDGGATEFCDDFCIDDEVVDDIFGAGSIAYRQTSGQISSSASLSSTSRITYDAGEVVNLNQGFTILQGGQFIAKIDGCE